MNMLQNCAFFEFDSKHKSTRKQSIECIKYFSKALRIKGLDYKIVIHKRTRLVFRVFKYKSSFLEFYVYEGRPERRCSMSLACLNDVIRWKDAFTESRIRIAEKNYPGEALVEFHKEVQGILNCDARFSNVKWVTYVEWYKGVYDEDVSEFMDFSQLEE